MGASGEFGRSVGLLGSEAGCEMTAPKNHDLRRFTLDEAETLLPLVRAIVSDMVTLAAVMADRKSLLDRLCQVSRGKDDPYGEELRQSRESLAVEAGRLQAYVAELTDLGVIPLGMTDGGVEFPSQRHGREVFLSWRLGESGIGYWREASDEVTVRRPLERPAHNRLPVSDAAPSPERASR